MRIRFITGNKKKFAEAKAIVPDLEQMDMDLPEIQELDPRKVIAAKLAEARRRQPDELIVEDTSLSLECLNGLPGPFIKWFLQAMGCHGLVGLAQICGNYRATARTLIGHIGPGGEISYFEGVISGYIADPHGEFGFGWDPIFVPDGSDRSFQQMSREEKNAISMRAAAFRQLKEFLDGR